MNAPTLPARLDRAQRRILCGWPPGHPRCSGFFGLVVAPARALGERDPLARRFHGDLFYIGDERSPFGLWLEATFLRAPDGVYRMGQHARRRYQLGQRPRNRRGLDDDGVFELAANGERPATGWYPWRNEWRHGFRAECPRCGRINVLHPALLFAETVFEHEILPDGAVRWRALIFNLDDAARTS